MQLRVRIRVGVFLSYISLTQPYLTGRVKSDEIQARRDGNEDRRMHTTKRRNEYSEKRNEKHPEQRYGRYTFI